MKISNTILSIESNCCSVVRSTEMTANQSGSGFQFITHINEPAFLKKKEPAKREWCRVQTTEPCSFNFSVKQSKIDVPAHEYHLSKFTE
jgi:hypothetical protein